MNDKRIIAYLKGGLGNQCFIYAAAKSLAKRAAARLCLNVDYFPGDRIYRRRYDLGQFAVKGELMPLRRWPFRMAEELRYQVVSGVMRRSRVGNFICDHRPFKYRPLPLDWNGTLHMDGYWHAYGYYKDVMPDIYDDFELRGDDSWLVNDEVYKRIVDNDKAYFCHVRSYKEVPGHANGDMSAGIEYYSKAIGLMHEKLGDGSVCFLFSDDLDWAADRLSTVIRNTGQKIVCVTNRQGVDNQLRDFMLMRTCRNGIVGNSSFSGFAGVLADCGAQKRGVERHIIRSRYSMLDYFPDDWTLV